jgi:SAM-dependent methyltransferase
VQKNKEQETICKSVYNSVKPYIQKDIKILCLGCKYGSKLFPFLTLSPTKIYGIDIDENSINKYYFEYIKYLKNYHRTIISEIKLSGDINEEFQSNSKLLNWETLVHFPSYKEKIEQMNKILELKHSSIQDFEFSDSFDLIIASNSLHFLKHKLQSEVISKIYSCLSSNGVFYLRNNILEKCITNDWETRHEKIADKIIRLKTRRNGELIYYLNSLEELSEITNMFSKKIDVTNYIPGKLSNAYVYVK